MCFDSLATYDNDWQVHLRHLARPVEVSDDGLTYTITIRDDLKWSGDIPVTAEDYVYTLKNLMFSDWLNYTYQTDWQEEVEGETVFVDVALVDETTFTVKRQTVDPEFIDNAIYSLTPYPKHIAVKYEGDLSAFTEAEEFNNLTTSAPTGSRSGYGMISTSLSGTRTSTWVRRRVPPTLRNTSPSSSVLPWQCWRPWKQATSRIAVSSRSR